MALEIHNIENVCLKNTPYWLQRLE